MLLTRSLLRFTKGILSFTQWMLDLIFSLFEPLSFHVLILCEMLIGRHIKNDQIGRLMLHFYCYLLHILAVFWLQVHLCCPFRNEKCPGSFTLTTGYFKSFWVHFPTKVVFTRWLLLESKECSSLTTRSLSEQP